MAIKDLFHLRSKSRPRSNSKGNDLSRSTTPTPSAALGNVGSSPVSNNTQSPRGRASTSNLIGNATAKNATPYDSQPAGRPPSIGASPLPGNGSVGEDRARARSIGTGRSMDMRRTSQGTSTTTGTTTTSDRAPSSVTTTTTTQTTTGSRPSSRQGHKQGLSRSQDLGYNTYTSREAPPQLPRIDSSSLANDQQAPSGALPIASEFSSSSWNQQHSSPAMPSYEEVFPRGLNSSASAGDVPMTPTNTNIYSSNGASMASHSNVTEGQRSTSIPRKNVGELRNSSNANTARSQMSQPASSTQSTGDNHTMSIPRKSISDLRDRNHLPGSQQNFPTREQSLGGPAMGNSVPGMSSTQHPLGSSTMANTTAQATTTGHSSSTAGYAAPQVGEIRPGRQQIYNRPYLVEGASSPPSLEGIVDLTNTVDTTTHIRYAPAVLHETIRPTVHSLREEQYTREFHNYHIHHRPQPIIDVQVLPPKHLVRIEEGVYKEVAVSQLPGRPETHFVIAETVSKIPGETVDRKAMGNRHFTARTFHPEEGEHREYVSNAGVPTTESTWIHPPRLAQAGRVAGETVAFPMDERAEAAASGPGWVDGQGHVVVGGGMPGATQ